MTAEGPSPFTSLSAMGIHVRSTNTRTECITWHIRDKCNLVLIFIKPSVRKRLATASLRPEQLTLEPVVFSGNRMPCVFDGISRTGKGENNEV